MKNKSAHRIVLPGSQQLRKTDTVELHQPPIWATGRKGQL